MIGTPPGFDSEHARLLIESRSELEDRVTRLAYAVDNLLAVEAPNAKL